MTRLDLLALVSLDCDSEWRGDNADVCLRLEDDARLQALEDRKFVAWYPVVGYPGMRVVRLTPLGRRCVEQMLGGGEK